MSLSYQQAHDALQTLKTMMVDQTAIAVLEAIVVIQVFSMLPTSRSNQLLQSKEQKSKRVY